MRWDEFHRTVSDEYRKFPIPKTIPRLTNARDDKIGGVIGVLDNEHHIAVDDIVRNFAETRRWKIDSDVHRILVWLRLNFARDFFGFLTLGMETWDPEWKPVNVVTRIHDACDDAFLWNWILIDAWHRCGVPQIQQVIYCVSHLRRPSKRDKSAQG